ncbi:hypothetical protein [Laspinema palackyanum]|uniref:hypothetical protein n=1 Tax=Laspinema palackyanum TaxID=3231601 RepID=UPI00345C7603|nr:hypothetical protein [Laspinema sp. D2c]
MGPVVRSHRWQEPNGLNPTVAIAPQESKLLTPTVAISLRHSFAYRILRTNQADRLRQWRLPGIRTGVNRITEGK